ncbi:NAD-dependent epimerase/dehydratase family protein [Pusillimonas sp.]|uniref:NAD-dependent epimerase/dehydratase family protein n=1 Tax=Pusillimonas sp. TaxID=3040095 RepID=UPI0029AA6C3B|nr:NAD-dependent epimerase/dehydratase family protein [Pusillimonas sp.]MDX3895737.1 NAD-dependent epimerase/dehydratase family protein [Pusillimonas sp.]
MKHVLVTGANGHISQALARALAKRLASGEMQGLTLTDLMLDDQACHHPPGVRLVAGDRCDKAVLDAALASAPDTVFHLASITSRRAEEDFALGLRVNLDCTFALFEYLRRQEQRPVVVFASSIGVFGTPLPGQVAELLRAARSRYGSLADAKLRFQPQPQLEKQFAQWPPLTTSIAARLGMHHDGDVDTLIERALASEACACCPDPTTKERISS